MKSNLVEENRGSFPKSKSSQQNQRITPRSGLGIGIAVSCLPVGITISLKAVEYLSLSSQSQVLATMFVLKKKHKKLLLRLHK